MQQTNMTELCSVRWGSLPCRRSGQWGNTQWLRCMSSHGKTGRASNVAQPNTCSTAGASLCAGQQARDRLQSLVIEKSHHC